MTCAFVCVDACQRGTVAAGHRRLARPFTARDHIAFARGHLAKELGRTIRTFERWETARTGPPIMWLGKQPLYRRQAVQDWLLQQARHPPLPPSGP